ncbi:universal stress protein [Saxibacter everestensis]|uniref:Universal stress protein n=1 Tax=Saxibacter everestensis TaxID=2909229 RepID=A0ABY8QV72_9MICO|nr:universal stress protein [Brevibacteriaceae bacterium ZFBP1038]
MTILVGYTPNREGEAALDYAIKQAEFFAEDLLVVNAAAEQTQADDLRLIDEQQANRIRTWLAETPLSYDVRKYIRGKDAAEEIIELSEKHQVSLIVLGIRKRSPVGKLLLGSVAQSVLLRATVPVTTVKA